MKIIFDNFGVLTNLYSVETEEDIEAINELLEPLYDQMGFVTEAEELAQTVKFLFDDAGVPQNKFTARALEDKKALIQLMAELKANGHEIGVVTGGLYEPLPTLIGGTSRSQFDFVIEKADKGKADTWSRVLRQVDANAQDVLMIDDSSDNIEMAAKSNIDGVTYTNAAMLRQELQKRSLIA